MSTCLLTRVGVNVVLVCRDVDMPIIAVSLLKINMNNRRSYTKTVYFLTRFGILMCVNMYVCMFSQIASSVDVYKFVL